jgi:hypothetical protein
MDHGTANHDVKYERSDADPRSLARFMLYLVVGVLVVAFVVREMYLALAAHEASLQPPPPIMQFEANRVPPAPRLEEHPQDELATHRAEQARIITTYGWVDKEHGTARVPVTEAMSMLLAKGLPVAPAASPSPASEKGK